MINKDSTSKQLSKRQKELMDRFRNAYERLNYGQRQIARLKFCAEHDLTVGTFRNKLSGFSNVSETEVEWMEGISKEPSKLKETSTHG